MAQVTDPRRMLLPFAVACALTAACGAATAQGAPAPVAPAQGKALDQQAREASWAGDTRRAMQLMEQHLAAHPEDRVARLDHARYQAWNGDYAAAIAALDALGADDGEARALRARILAWDGRRAAALALNTPLYEAAPQDHDLAWTQALALRLGEWPQQALPALATVQQLKPDGDDSRDLAKAVRLPLFSRLGAVATVYDDSDDIEIRDLGLEADLRVTDRWRLLAGATRREHSAPVTSPFAPVTGGRSVDEHRVGLGARLAVTTDSAMEFWLGRSGLDPGGSESIGHVTWSHHASDGFWYRVRAERDRMAASPRSVSLGVLRTGIGLSTEWRPTLRDTLRTGVAFDDFNDGNRRHWVQADYRRALHRGPRANIDVGGQVEWMGYSRDPGNGYYSPDRYVRVAPLVSTYLKLGEEVGLHLQAVAGAQRDENFSSWKRATDLSAELTLGIFSHWQLVAQAARSERLNEFGQYDGNRFGLLLRYRFCEHRADRCPRPDGP